jgi:zinc transport system substrate-binding protein
MALCVLSLAAPALAGPLPVVVSVAPQKFFVEKLAGPLAQVSVMVSPGADAHTFEPKPSQMAKAAAARLYFAQGVDFERVWLPRLAASNKDMRVVDTLAGVELLPLSGHDDHGHGKHKGHAHKDAQEHKDSLSPKDNPAPKDTPGHSGMESDVHTWTSPRLVKLQAATMAKALTEADPDNAAAYAANLKSFQAELDALDAALEETLKCLGPGSSFLVFHPAFAYFARDYGLIEKAIETGGREPGPRQLQKIVNEARESGAKIILVQPQFSRKTAQTVAGAVGAKLVDADDLAPDWAENLKRIAGTLCESAR